MEIDPLISLLVGAFGATLLGFVGAWIQSRREHAKWYRERRFEAYLKFLTAADKWSVRMSQQHDSGEDPPEFFDEMTSAEAGVELAGPAAVVQAMDPIRAHILGWAHKPDSHVGPYATEYWKLRTSFVEAARAQISKSRDIRAGRFN